MVFLLSAFLVSEKKHSLYSSYWTVWDARRRPIFCNFIIGIYAKGSKYEQLLLPLCSIEIV